MPAGAHAAEPADRLGQEALPRRSFRKGMLVMIPLAAVVSFSGYLAEQAEASRLADGRRDARDAEALQLARAHWDTPVVRLLTLDRIVTAVGPAQADGCAVREVTALSWFGSILDRVTVFCDDSVQEQNG
jgi:hypothetical protein